MDFDALSANEKSESSEEIRKRVNAARELQQERYKEKNITCNARLNASILHDFCPMTDRAKAMLKRAFESMGLSARAYDRILKVARTIADLDGSEVIQAPHLAEALQYRPPEYLRR